MPCRFLKQGQARFCRAASIRKLILIGVEPVPGRCASADHRLCELVRDPDPAATRCPHLDEISVQYCAASPVTKLVPASHSQLSRCNSTAYRYCDAYLAAGRSKPFPAPSGLLSAPNHFWLHADESRLCHIGIDALLAGLAGSIDAVNYVTTRGLRRPIVTLALHGVEWPMVFPNALVIDKVNTALHRNPERIAADPYGAGWMFEGWEVPAKTRAGLIGGPEAAAWQTEERERLAQSLRESGGRACDGGLPQPGAAGLLSRSDMVALFQRFFSRREWIPEDF